MSGFKLPRVNVQCDEWWLFLPFYCAGVALTLPMLSYTWVSKLPFLKYKKNLPHRRHNSYCALAPNEGNLPFHDFGKETPFFRWSLSWRLPPAHGLERTVQDAAAEAAFAVQLDRLRHCLVLYMMYQILQARAPQLRCPAPGPVWVDKWTLQKILESNLRRNWCK